MSAAPQAPSDLDLDARRRADDPIAAAVRSTQVPVTIADLWAPDRPIVFANDAFLTLTGYAREEVIGRNCRFLQGPDTDPQVVERMRRALRAREDILVEVLNYRRDGSSFWNALHMSPVRDAGGEVRYVCGSQIDVTRARAVEAELRDAKAGLERAVEARTSELRQALEQKTHLLHEVDHRVKNNLQLISSLMLLQTRRSAAPDVQRELRRMQERLNAISTVHRRLFQSDDAARFDVADFLNDLAADLIGSSGRDDIVLELALEPVDVPASQAAPLALLLNELVTNALVHAFPDRRPGALRISTARRDDLCRIRVVDDGVGSRIDKPGFGLTIVQLLARQLKAQTRFEDARPGVAAHVALPIHEAA